MDTVVRSSNKSFLSDASRLLVGSNNNVYWTCWHQVCNNSDSDF